MPDLSHDAGADPSFPDRDAAATAGEARAAVSSDVHTLPPAIGQYRILRLLGEGGMGAVYEAEQASPHRTVALKVIRSGYANSEMLRRFDNETQALGRLQHPGIAQIYEAGTAETQFGRQPYFAMELIRGETLLRYCDAHKLSVRQRLQLMAKICDAVLHAHQRGLIHRDLKPANILVGEDGQPKILDFGVARLTDSDAQATRQTNIGQIVGTLAYMSPEQVLGDPDEIDTRSDVYALGVILYELLAGKAPYEIGRQIHEAVRTIREEEPSALSVVNRAYRGDIETIVSKALEKEKTRRYGSAAELAADIRRYLHDEPILARPPGTAYQIRKFARRNRALVTGVAAVFVVLVVGVFASTWEAVKARRETAIAQAVNDFLQNDLLGQASAYNQSKADPDIRVRTVLDRAAQSVQGKFDKHPEVEGAIRDTIGQTYTDVGLYPEARRQLERAVRLERMVSGPDSPAAIRTLLHLEDAEEAQGLYAQAEGHAREALAASRGALGKDNPTTITAMNRLVSALDYEGKYAEAEPLAVQAVAISRRVSGDESRGTLASMHFLAIVYFDEGKNEQAETLNRQLLSVQQRLLGPEHPDTLSTMNNLAAVYGSEHRYAQQEALDEKLLELRRRVLGPEHPDTLDAMSNLGFDYRGERKFDQAAALDVQLLEIDKRVLGPEHPSTLRSMHNLAADTRMLGDAPKAEALDRQTLAIRQRVLGAQNPDTLWSMNNLAGDLRAERQYAQAAALDRQALALRTQVLGADHRETLQSTSALAQDYAALGQYAEVDAVYRKALQTAPRNPTLLNSLAWYLLSAEDRKLRNPQEGLEMAQRAIAAAPGNAAILNTLGLAQVRNGLWDSAIATLNESAAKDGGEEPTDYLFLAMARQGKGDKAAAQASYARALQLAGTNAARNPELRMLMNETAEALGKRSTSTPPTAR
ncbi:MAG: tetratricopeptide repeat protein [Acidobacteriaceae bacterium]